MVPKNNSKILRRSHTFYKANPYQKYKKYGQIKSCMVHSTKNNSKRKFAQIMNIFLFKVHDKYEKKHL